jgi:hypothetical protein
MPATAKVTRRNLTLPESSIARIAAIRAQTEAASDSEVVRRALRLYESLLKGDAVIQDKNTGQVQPVGMF